MWTRVARIALPALFALLAAACGPKYPKCEKDSHCEKKGEVCVEGTCQQCRDAAQCAAGQECKGGRCEVAAECSADGDCKDRKVCRSGKCQVECTTAADCGGGNKCSRGRCMEEQACEEASDCPSGVPCMRGRCGATENASRQISDRCELTSINFDFNESVLRGDAKDKLSSAADCLKTKSGQVTIEGHCDERGTEEYNLALGDARANSVKKYLVNLGVPGNKLNVVSKGELEPVDPGHDESAWAKNRRAQFVER